MLVVGASGGLGGEITRALAARGARVAAAGRDETRLKVLPHVAVLTGDLRSPQVPQTLVEQAGHRLGGLDGVVYAAGVVGFGSVTELDDDDVDELVLLNFLAPLRLTRAALRVLPRAGFVANLSAVVAEQPTRGMAAYSASKAALTAFDAVARLEARGRGVRVLDVRPPHTETGLAARPIVGAAPALPDGLAPRAVAERIVTAIAEGETDLPASA
ncbi:MAG: SDR family NAD(P)-dependent oxidoreductase, partial [Actinomycetes bacterium]